MDYEPKSKLWEIKDHWSVETVKYKMGSMQALVQYMDGDGSVWTVWKNHEIIASGSEYVPDDFGTAIRKAEEILIQYGFLKGE